MRARLTIRSLVESTFGRGIYRTAAAFSLIGIAAACAAAPSASSKSEQTMQGIGGSCTSGITASQSLFVAPVDDTGNANPLGVAALQQFSFQSVMNQIVATGGGGSSQTALELYQQMLDTLNQAPGDTSGPHCTGTINGFSVDCPRPEGVLASTDPFTAVQGPPSPTDSGFLDTGSPDGGGYGFFEGGTDDASGSEGGTGLEDGSSFDGGAPDGAVVDAGLPPPTDFMTPIALVNRFDLAPANGANCGQYRVVFAIPSPTAPVLRFFMIFEAVLPNPAPSQGLAACMPVAEFWANLSAPGITQDEFVSKLTAFYFTGLEGLPGNPAFPPVIQAQNYGIGSPSNTNTGQIRVNMLSTAQWQLREFTLSQYCDGDGVCTLTANNTFVKDNPFGGLFQNGGDATFQAQFVQQVPTLAASSLPLISMTNPNQYNAGQSSEQDTTNDYACQAGLGSTANDVTQCTPSSPANASLNDAIQAELTSRIDAYAARYPSTSDHAVVLRLPPAFPGHGRWRRIHLAGEQCLHTSERRGRPISSTSGCVFALPVDRAHELHQLQL
jgi:hypothetical protein